MTAAMLIVASFLARQPTALVVQVDLIIVNRVRSYSVEFDQWDRPRFSPSFQWWVSYWDFWRVPSCCGLLSGQPTSLLIDRGWIVMSHRVRFSRVPQGVLLDDGDGINVHAGMLVVIDSDFDIEMRWRKIYDPIRRP